MPAILGPGSVSLETCAETRKLESTESLSPGGSLSPKPALKAVDPETEGVIERAARGCSATVPPWRPPLCQADRVRTTHFDSTHRSKAHRCNAWSSPLAYLEVRSHVM